MQDPTEGRRPGPATVRRLDRHHPAQPWAGALLRQHPVERGRQPATGLRQLPGQPEPGPDHCPAHPAGRLRLRLGARVPPDVAVGAPLL